jgi:serine/threonine protein kinase
LLGEGQFGKVFRGTLTAHPGVSDKAAAVRLAPLPVAVKVPRNGRSVRDQKALLDELKIMIAIGQHVNVLGLIGAVTKNMTKGELSVVTELCELGSLLDYLRSHRAFFLNEIVADEAPRSFVGYTSLAAQVTSSDLLSFGYQTANGMDYLAQKTVLLLYASLTLVD